MKYLRTEEDIKKFSEENNISEISMASITKAIEETYDLNQLGYFQSISMVGFGTYKKRGGTVEKQTEFAAMPEVLDFIVNSGIFSDVLGEYPKADTQDVFGFYSGTIVKLFGKMEKGKIVELIGFNTGNYFATSFTKYADQTVKRGSVDLWF